MRFKNPFSKAEESEITDFDVLIEKVKQMPESEGQTILWTEVFKLPKWHFIVKSNNDLNATRPFIGEFEGKGWFDIVTKNFVREC